MSDASVYSADDSTGLGYVGATGLGYVGEHPRGAVRSQAVLAGAKKGEDQSGRSWLDYQHQTYTAQLPRWAFTRDFYTGDVLDPARIRSYLIRKAAGESEATYDERCRIADYTTHMANVVDGLVGMLAAVEVNATRVFAPAPEANEDSTATAARGLGDPADPSTPIGRLFHSASPDGEDGYLTTWKRLASALTLYRGPVWLLVDGEPRRPTLQVLDPTRVPNWVEEGGGSPVEVLVPEEVDVRESLEDEPGLVQQWVVFGLEGWKRYRKDARGNPEQVPGDQGEGSYTYLDPRTGKRALPIFPVSLPIDRDVGYLLAKKASAIFNQESGRDALIRLANFPRLVLPMGEEAFDAAVAKLAAGGNIIQEDPQNSGNTRFIGPDTACVAVANETLKRKVEEFYVTAAREYGDSARQRTATEVKQDVASGVGAFLTLLADKLDDAENGVLWRIEQFLHPTDKSKWGICRVERSDDFLPADPEAVLKRQAELAFGVGKSVPLGKTGAVAVARQIAAYQGIAVRDEELEAAVEVRLLLDALAIIDVDLPALARAEIAMKLLVSSGLVDADAVAALQDGTEAKLVDVLRQQAVELAEAADQAKRREAELVAGSIEQEMREAA